IDIANAKVLNATPKIGVVPHTMQIQPNDGFTYPQGITVLNNGVPAASGIAYLYDNITGEIQLNPVLLGNSSNMIIKAASPSSGARSLTLPQIDTNWDNIYYGNYPQDQPEETFTQPLLWRVLNMDGQNGTIQLLSDKAVDFATYSPATSAWYRDGANMSTIPAFLNGSSSNQFSGKAFTNQELEAIRTTSAAEWPAPDNNNLVPAPANIWTQSQPSVSGKLSILSYNDVINPAKTGWSSLAATNSLSRQAFITEYARAKGAFNTTVKTNVGGYGHWWLRSPATTDTTISYVNNTTGAVGSTTSLATTVNVRPTMKLNLADILWTTSAYNGKLAALPGNRQPKQMEDLSPGQAKKLTMKDAKLNPPTISSVTGTTGAVQPDVGAAVAANSVISVSYSQSQNGQTTDRGNNCYLSVALVDAVTNTLRYHLPIAKLDNARDITSSGNATFNTPNASNLIAKFYVEQLNGNYQTDFCNKEKAPVFLGPASTGNWVVPMRVDLKHGTLTNAAPRVDTQTVMNILPDSGYTYPRTIQIFNNGTQLVLGTDFEYDNSSGAVTVKKATLTTASTLVIKATAVPNQANNLNMPVTSTSWDNIYLGTYPQDQKDGNIKQPIAWRVTNIDGGSDTIQLLSETVIDQSIVNSSATSLWADGTYSAGILNFLNGRDSNSFAG
ncbi:MAG: DUF6273 domain-containing protein, partial [Anaerovoracaceae bacterium]